MHNDDAFKRLIGDENEYNEVQLYELKMGFKTGVDISKYASADLDWAQMFFYRKGLEMKLDVSIYKDKDWRTMNYLQQAQLKKLPLERYLEQPFTGDQIREIILGLQEKLDVEQYADPQIPVAKMALKRIELELEKSFRKAKERKLHGDELTYQRDR